MKDFFSNIWTKRVFSVIASLYTVCVCSLCYYSIFYSIAVESRMSVGLIVSGISLIALVAHVRDYLDVFQPMVYILAFLACVRGFATKSYRQLILPGMFFVGGFLFQTLFESAARYCMIYFLVLSAFASCEIVNIRKAIERYGKKRNHA